MSDKQNSDLAWVARFVIIGLLGFASTMGWKVYAKVDEMYSDFSKQQEINMNLKQADIDMRQDLKELRFEVATLRLKNYQLRSQVNSLDNE